MTAQPHTQIRVPETEGLELAVPARPENVAVLRRAVTAFAQTAGLGEGTAADVALAVGEACANVVVHAYAEDDSAGPVLEVRARLAGARLLVVVADHGGGMAPRTDSPGLGLGLPLMATLASSLELRESTGGGTEVWMTFDSPVVATGAIEYQRSA
jgi:anti-sigma regulatory factor (Ser/Thr protein kinase)